MTGAASRGGWEPEAILLDLDETLMPDEDSVNSALAAAASSVLQADGQAAAIPSTVRRVARELWEGSRYWTAGERLGLAWWELLWGSFEDGDETIRAIRGWLPEFRERCFATALAAAGLPANRWPKLHEEFARERASRCRCYPGVLEMLRTLGSGHRLGIVTNGPPDLQRTKISLSGLQELVEAVVISGEVGFGKPDQRIFRLALEALGAEAGRAVMVGDNAERDVAGAHASGLRAIWVGHHRPLPKAVQPDAVIQNTVELPRGLARLAGLD